MPDRSYLVPAQETRAEIEVIRSRFIATAAPARTVKEARSFILDIKRRFADATHNVSAYVVGHGTTVTAHAHDDGEPSGTAGRPALAVLQGSGLGDIVVVVTRYFGGTKLGTGGLVRAYGDAVREVLSVLPLAMRVPTQTVRIEIPYPLFEQVRLLIEAHQGQVLEQDFGIQVTLMARFAMDRVPAFQAAFSELSNGSLGEIVHTDEATLVPVGTFAGGMKEG